MIFNKIDQKSIKICPALSPVLSCQLYIRYFFGKILESNIIQEEQGFLLE
jgi:hypothetical protein